MNDVFGVIQDWFIRNRPYALIALLAVVAVLLIRYTSGRVLWAISRHSLQEAIRKRVLLVSIIFGLALVVSAPFWPSMNDADRIKLVEEISLTAMTFLGVIIAVFVSAYSLPDDIEEKRVFTLSTKPVHRHEMVLGKFFGFLMVFVLILGVMGAISTLLIRGVSTYSQVEVTAPEAPIIVNGTAVGAAGKGRLLRLLGREGDNYRVALPDDLAIRDGSIAVSAATLDKTTGQVTVTAPSAEIVYNGVTIARAAAGRHFRLKEIDSGSYTVVLPEDLRAQSAQVPASATSEPRRNRISAKRVAMPVDTEYHNVGKADVDDGRLVLYAPNVAVNEILHFDGIDPSALPAGDDVKVVLRIGGIYGTAAGSDASGGPGQNELTRFNATVRLMNLHTRETKEVQTQGIWSTNSFGLNLTIPRRILEGGSIAAGIIQAEPAFKSDALDFFAGTRRCVWYFRGLKLGRFPVGKINGEMQFDLRYRQFPANGGMVADVKFRVSRPDGSRRETITVPIRNAGLVSFSFDREMIDDSGSTVIEIAEVPEKFTLGIPSSGARLTLLERPTAFEWSYAKTILLVLCQLVIVCGAAVAASTFVSGGVAALTGFFVYFCGLLVDFMKGVLEMGPEALSSGPHHGPEAAESAAHTSWPLMSFLLKGFVALVPDMSKLDTRVFLLSGLDVPGGWVTRGVLATLLYSLVFMVVAHVIFRQKELG
ncbi:MAG TPA: ABC transporter permease [Planctomycetota bacterium]|nr:ABC transporter permease [Planctomycetota bacterium]